MKNKITDKLLELAYTDSMTEVQNPPKQTNNAPKTKESVQSDKSVSALRETPKPQSKATAQVKTKETYIQAQAVKSETPAPKVKTENSVDAAFSSKSMPKTKESYIRSQGKTPADIIKTPNKAKAVPKQNTHTVTRNVSSNAKKAVKTKDSFSNGTRRAVKTGNSYVGRGQQNNRNKAPVWT